MPSREDDQAGVGFLQRAVLTCYVSSDHKSEEAEEAELVFVILESRVDGVSLWIRQKENAEEGSSYSPSPVAGNSKFL